MADEVEITSERLVAILDNYLFGWAYKDIERASIQGTAKLGGFILGACFVDAMASFHAGVDRDAARTGAGERFRGFIEEYMNQYDAEKLWRDLRCGLVHCYSEGGTYVFTHNNEAGFHLDETANGKVILNLEDFCADLRNAYGRYRKDILNDEDAFGRAKRRFKSLGLMAAAPVDRL